MGPSSISLGSLLLIAAVVCLLFGRERLKGLAEEVSGVIRRFQQGTATSEASMRSDSDKDRPTDV